MMMQLSTISLNPHISVLKHICMLICLTMYMCTVIVTSGSSSCCAGTLSCHNTYNPIKVPILVPVLRTGTILLKAQVDTG